MLFIVCPTCSGLLGHLQIIIDNGLEAINNINLDNKDIKKIYAKELELIQSEYKNKNQIEKKLKEKLKLNLINNLGLTNQCCRMRVLTYIRLVDIIK